MLSMYFFKSIMLYNVVLYYIIISRNVRKCVILYNHIMSLRGMSGSVVKCSAGYLPR